MNLGLGRQLIKDFLLALSAVEDDNLTGELLRAYPTYSTLMPCWPRPLRCVD